ncbi:hypothetical protein MMC17_007750 [Xylographa soralifera]|nr:hypothetical protein [Xylographa soralifera]
MNASTSPRVQFLGMICTFGTFRMLKPFLDAGVDVNEGDQTGDSYLGKAVGAENFEIFQILLDRDAAAGPAFFHLPSMSGPYDHKHLLRDYIPRIVDQVTYMDFNEYFYDPIHNFLRRWSYPNVVIIQALEHFLCTGLFNNGRLFGGESISLDESYIYQALRYGHDRALSLFLKHGIYQQSQIGNQFSCPYFFSELRYDTWLTLAVHLSDAACVEVLLKYADMHVRDGSGRDALEWARYYMAGKHPRRAEFPPYTTNAEQDKRILVILEKALASQPMTHSESVIATPDIIPNPDAEPGLFAYRSWKDFKHSAYHLYQHLTWLRLAEYIFPHYLYTWYNLSKLSYTDTILMRLGYVLSYILLLLFETIAIVTWLRQLPAPPRSILMAGVVLVLGLTYSMRSLPELSQTLQLR